MLFDKRITEWPDALCILDARVRTTFRNSHWLPAMRTCLGKPIMRTTWNGDECDESQCKPVCKTAGAADSVVQVLVK
jgi:hypothetical protein